MDEVLKLPSEYLYYYNLTLVGERDFPQLHGKTFGLHVSKDTSMKKFVNKIVQLFHLSITSRRGTWNKTEGDAVIFMPDVAGGADIDLQKALDSPKLPDSGPYKVAIQRYLEYTFWYAPEATDAMGSAVPYFTIRIEQPRHDKTDAGDPMPDLLTWTTREQLLRKKEHSNWRLREGFNRETYKTWHIVAQPCVDPLWFVAERGRPCDALAPWRLVNKDLEAGSYRIMLRAPYESLPQNVAPPPPFMRPRAGGSSSAAVDAPP